ncbi:MAG: nucleoside kinase [Tissierellia bacterium]|nr:nucleoside kinase [Tissierellia bacterium]
MAEERLRVSFLTGEGIKEVQAPLKEGARYQDLAEAYGSQLQGQVTLALVDNQLHELADKVGEGVRDLVLLDTVNTDGYRTYMRSLSFVFLAAARRVLPKLRLLVEHSISGGTYCTLRRGEEIISPDSRTRDRIRAQMEAMIRDDLPIKKEVLSLAEARLLFKDLDRQDKLDLLNWREEKTLSTYQLGEDWDHFFGYMVPSTGYLTSFGLEIFNQGLVLMGPVRDQRGQVRNFRPQHKLSVAYNEVERGTRLQGISHVDQLNRAIEKGQVGEISRVTEALQDYKIMKIAEDIKASNRRFIFISAPSSSGKTSFSYKLRTSLKVLGLRPVTLSLDDYYVNREDTPLNEAGDYDFEALEAIELARLNQDLTKLLRGEAIERIRFDFVEGLRVHTGRYIQLKGDDPVIIEGTHALNPRLTDLLDPAYIYRIYLSVISQVHLDDHNRIPTTDIRLMRRMARDKASRGKSIRQTLREWGSVRAGEKKYIFPYQERADVVFNASFPYEISAIKPIILEDLEAIGPQEEVYIQAQRLRGLLQYFKPLEDHSDIPGTSILREFIGGSKIAP